LRVTRLDHITAVTPKETRDAFRRFETPRDFTAARLVATDALLYCALVITIVHFHSWLLKAVLAIPAGVAITRLFILGHDACHGSLFSRGWINRAIGRLCFLALVTSYSLWELGHNTIHHGFTNLKGRDTIWTPLSPGEYKNASRLSRWRNRLYRTPWGVGFYYFAELWWNKLFFPSKNHVGVRRRQYLWDNLLVTFYLCLLVSAVGMVSRWPWEASANILFGLVLPWIVSYWIVGFTVFVHHTHPSVQWFRNRRQWSFQRGQIEGTVHMRFPRWYSLLLHNIYEHTAHHIDSKIPCYRLAEAQRFAESRFSSQVVVERFTWEFYVRTLRDCQLYDYEQGVWLRFDGTPTYFQS
jgi:omega-6 fatty acid desaturase (delta-12 desaturase)